LLLTEHGPVGRHRDGRRRHNGEEGEEKQLHGEDAEGDGTVDWQRVTNKEDWRFSCAD